jgi:hypothetical protein
VIDAALFFVGDCFCGNPLVDRAGRVMCAVYGRHGAPLPPAVVPEQLELFRDSFIAGPLLKLMMATPGDRRRARPHMRARSAVAARRPG